MPVTLRIGIDLGGTKIEGVVLDPHGRELARERRPTPTASYDAILTALATLVADLERAAGGVASVGIGTPGSISPRTGLMRNSNTVCLNGRPMVRDLEHALARPVRMANDADCFTLSEAVDGAAAGADVVFGVIIGTGVGGGIACGGTVAGGANGLRGEWGHNGLTWPSADEIPGRPCYCGRNGCVETFLSGPGMSADHEAATGDRLPAPEIVAAAERGAPEAVRTLERYEHRFARALAHVINLLDPDVIVLGGGLSQISRLYEQVPRLWGAWVFSREAVRTPLLPPRHGDASGVRGAAWLWGGPPERDPATG